MKKLIFILITIVIAIFWDNDNIESYIESNSNHNYQSNKIIKFDLNGEMREYLLHIPKNIHPNAPLVFVLHGLRSTALYIQENTRMDSVADKNGFVVCYPQGSSSTEKTIYTEKGSYFWNVGYEIHKNETVDDIFFKNHLQYFYNKNTI